MPCLSCESIRQISTCCSCKPTQVFQPSKVTGPGFSFRPISSKRKVRKVQGFWISASSNNLMPLLTRLDLVLLQIN